jgi:hypothetical protein
MNRREFLTAGIGVGLAFRIGSTRAATQSSALKLFVDRKVMEPTCMRGYLLTQLDGEPAPSIACYVLERPPIGNLPYVSAIPAGAYSVRVRRDGTLGWRLQLDRVPGRTNVQIHVGNFPADTVGCLLPGAGTLPNTCVVQNSAAAMKQLRTLFTLFGDDGLTEITIRNA